MAMVLPLIPQYQDLRESGMARFMEEASKPLDSTMRYCHNGVMHIKDEVLDILLSRKGERVSGQEIADALSCSRMAVSKSVSQLQEEGFGIDTQKGSGYVLITADVLSGHVLSPLFPIPVYAVQECRSTMIEARDLINKGIEAPFAVMAGSQQGGRGRLGRSFFSPVGGVYFSIVLPGEAIPSPDLLTISASLAVSRVIERLTGRTSAIKWVNDVYVDGFKIVGILTEGIVNMELGGLDKAIVGVGINLSGDASSIPSDLRDKMAFLYPLGSSPVTRGEMAGAITTELLSLQGTRFMDEYRAKCFVIGRPVTVLKAGRHDRDGYAYGVDDEGHLLVEYPGGEREALSSGEVSLRL